MDQLKDAKDRVLHITQLDEDIKESYIRWLIDERVKELRSVFYPTEEELTKLMEGRTLPNPETSLNLPGIKHSRGQITTR